MAYPSFIVDNLGSLADYLLERPGADELDNRGALSPETQKHIESLIFADLFTRVREYEMPKDFARGTDPNNRWRTVSCMQKAVRFGDADMAVMAASAAFDMDEQYLFRRLGVTAVEDVAIGNVYGMLATLAVLGSKSFRNQVGGRPLGCFLADLLARGAKDRALTDLMIIADYGNYPKFPLSQLPHEELREHVLSGDVQKRACAAWLLGGTTRYEGSHMPTTSHPPYLLQALMVEQGLSRGMLYIAAKTASRLGMALWPPLIIIDPWLQATKKCRFDVNPNMPLTKVGLLLGAAYDMHTREGKAAIKKFMRVSAKELEPFLQHAKPGRAENMLSFGVFVSEGGLLNRKVVYDNVRELRSFSLEVELSYSGLPPEKHAAYMQFLWDSLPVLNQCRQDILQAKARG